MNIKNAYGHPMFYKEVDKATGFTTRWVNFPSFLSLVPALKPVSAC